jgi:hypothetical protein
VKGGAAIINLFIIGDACLVWIVLLTPGDQAGVIPIARKPLTVDLRPLERSELTGGLGVRIPPGRRQTNTGRLVTVLSIHMDYVINM